MPTIKPEVLAFAHRINAAVNLSQIQRDLKINPHNRDHSTALCLVCITTMMPLLGGLVGGLEKTFDLITILALMLGIDEDELAQACLKLATEMPE